DLLVHLIDSGNWQPVLVFTRTKHGANRLTQALPAGAVRAAAIHGNKSQAARARALSDFKQNRITAPVATALAARGVDTRAQPRSHGRHPSPRSHRAHSGKGRL